ncbi:MAG: xanthine dehydrogenase family protein subunit M [Paracoccaceae bacterium]|nr:xanthine dehydrogenase family protein subunit M [Paracoccaceae bacterium]
MYHVNYRRAGSVAEAADLLAEAEDGQLLAGGQTLIPTMKARLAAPSDLVDISGIEDLIGIREGDGAIEIGSMTPHAAVAASEVVRARIPGLAGLAAGIGDPAVRHRGTIGGSLANNDPAACYPAGVLALGATIVTNSREIAAEDFFLGLFATDLEEGEIIVAVRFPQPARSGYAKFPQPASRYPMAGVFAAETPSGIRVAVTGAGEDGVFRHEGLEAALAEDWSRAAAAAVEISPEGLASDIHGAADYRAALVSAMAAEAVARAASRKPKG